MLKARGKSINLGLYSLTSYDVMNHKTKVKFLIIASEKIKFGMINDRKIGEFAPTSQSVFLSSFLKDDALQEINDIMSPLDLVSSL